MKSFSVSFRIPFQFLGKVQYMNGSLFSTTERRPGEKIAVVGTHTSLTNAVVIQSVATTRQPDTFEWAEFKG